MPFPIAAAIAAGSSIASNIQQAGASKAARDWQIDMYNKQREHALADRDFENVYNSPAEQMKRLTAAGLNPNLVYGNGASASNSATTRQSSAPSAQPAQTTNIFKDALDTYFEARRQEILTDNTEAVIALNNAKRFKTEQEESTERWRTDEAQNRVAKQRQDLYVGEKSLEYQIDAARLRNEKTKADINFTLRENERQTAMNASNLKEAVQRIALMKANQEVSEANKAKIMQQTQKILQEIQLGKSDIQNAKLGLNKNDPMYLRVINSIIARAMGADVTQDQ